MFDAEINDTFLAQLCSEGEALNRSPRFCRALKLFEGLYSERGHFVYELLQNAEDAGATKFAFLLANDCLEIKHNGEPFSPKDVEAITGIACSTKDEDITAIGKFGIGFKSVFAYTKTPQIHSGKFNFEIRDYICPHAIEARDTGEHTTIIKLPFNKEALSLDTAIQEIKTALTKILPRKLLFLKSLKQICAKDKAEDVFDYSLIGEPAENTSPDVSVRQVSIGSEKWSIFGKSIRFNTVKSESVERQIEIAFKIGRPSNGLDTIIADNDSILYAFFPTEKRLGVGFLLQGPFRTTPARDNVKESDATNQEIIQASTELLIASIDWLKNNRRLSVGVLETLPLDEAHFPAGSLLRPLFDRTLGAFISKAWLPSALEGEHLPVDSLRLPHSDKLRKLVSPSQLGYLANARGWLTNAITRDQTPLLHRYLIKQLKLETVTAEVFVLKLTADFLMHQTDEWLIELYAYLNELHWIDERVTAPIVRLQAGEHVTPLNSNKGRNAYLPPEGETGFPVVKRTLLADDRAKRFLTDKLKLRAPDMCDDVIAHVLSRYQTDAVPNPEQYAHDLKKIVGAWSTDLNSSRERLREKLKAIPWILAENSANKVKGMKKPDEVYFRSDEMNVYFEGNDRVWFVSEYANEAAMLLSDLKVPKSPKISERKADRNGRVSITSDSWNHRRGLDSFDPDCKIDGFEHAIRNPTPQRSAYIWNCLLRGHAHRIRGEEESSTNQLFNNSRIEEKWTILGNSARNCAWLPDKSASFNKPADLCFDDLPEGFRHDENVVKALGMKDSGSLEALQGTVLTREMLNTLRLDPELGEKVKRLIEEHTMPRPQPRPSEVKQVSPSSSPNPTPAPTPDRQGRPAPAQPGPRPTQVNPQPEGRNAQEWLRSELKKHLDPNVWQISMGEEEVEEGGSRVDIVVRKVSDPLQRYYVEAKRCKAQFVHWSKRQIDTARQNQDRYHLAILHPEESDFKVHWIWEPLSELNNLNKDVLWTWTATPHGKCDNEWQPSDGAPSKQADSYSIKITLANIDDFPTGIEEFTNRIVGSSHNSP